MESSSPITHSSLIEREPAINGKRSREQDAAENIHKTLRPRWTSIAKAAGPPLKSLVENGLITQAERIQLLKNLIPDTEDGQLPIGTERETGQLAFLKI